jgi:hypothetical protein
VFMIVTASAGAVGSNASDMLPSSKLENAQNKKKMKLPTMSMSEAKENLILWVSS